MIEQLDMPIASLDGLSTADVKTIQDQLANSLALVKKRKEAFEALLARRFETAARAQYKAEDKDTGTVRLSAPGSNLLELKVEIDKTVVWDQAGLLGWLNKQTPEDARHYGKLKAEVAEDKYKNAPPVVRTALKAFRTVKAGKLKYTLVNREDEAEAA
jgi:hypothetical protein